MINKTFNINPGVNCVSFLTGDTRGRHRCINMPTSNCSIRNRNIIFLFAVFMTASWLNFQIFYQSLHTLTEIHLDFWRQRQPSDCRQSVEEKGPWDVGGRGRETVPQARRLDELLEEQAEEMVQSGSVIRLTERTAEDTMKLTNGRHYNTLK